MCVQVDKVVRLSFKICKEIPTEQGNNEMWSRFPLYFDLRLSSHSLIHIDRSRLREQTRALVGLLQSSIGQLHSNTIHMFYRQDLGSGGGKRNQASNPPPTNPPDTTAVPPSSDPVPGDHAKPSFDTECLTVVVNVLGEQLKVCTGGSRTLSMRMTCAVAGQIQQLSRVLGPNGQGFKSRL